MEDLPDDILYLILHRMSIRELIWWRHLIPFHLDRALTSETYWEARAAYLRVPRSIFRGQSPMLHYHLVDQRKTICKSFGIKNTACTYIFAAIATNTQRLVDLWQQHYLDITDTKHRDILRSKCLDLVVRLSCDVSLKTLLGLKDCLPYDFLRVLCYAINRSNISILRTVLLLERQEWQEAICYLMNGHSGLNMEKDLIGCRDLSIHDTICQAAEKWGKTARQRSILSYLGILSKHHDYDTYLQKVEANEISPAELEWALRSATSQGNTALVNMILKHGVADTTDCFCIACKKHPSLAITLLPHANMEEAINGVANAVRLGHFELLDRILCHNETWYPFVYHKAMSSACLNKSTDVLWLLTRKEVIPDMTHFRRVIGRITAWAPAELVSAMTDRLNA